MTVADLFDYLCLILSIIFSHKISQGLNVKLSMEYTVFHTNPLGWGGPEGGKRTPGFPYGGEIPPAGGADAFGGNAAADAFEDNMDEQQAAAEEEVLERSGL